MVKLLRPVLAVLTCVVALNLGCSPSPSAADPTIRPVNLDEEGKFRKRAEVDAILKEVKDKGVTDVFLVAHGWNNNSEQAQASYKEWLEKARAATKLKEALRPTPYVPLVIGVIWPSRAWDTGPLPEAGGTPPLTAAQKEAVKDALPPTAGVSEAERTKDQERMVALGEKGKGESKVEDVREAFKLARKYMIKSDQMKQPSHDDGFGPRLPVREAGEPVPEGAFSSAQELVRAHTFWQMKKRAGIVGENGVAELLAALKAARPGCRLHLYGHSFGAKVVLAAVLSAKKADTDFMVNTIGLLQGAISHQAFAKQVDGYPPMTPGAYLPVIAAVDGPIVATFSTHDWPLNNVYPLGARAGGQAGELEAASRHSALGAVGLDGVTPVTLKAAGTPYEFKKGLYSVAGSEFIGGHSLISDPTVAWMEWAAAVKN